ncbi:Nuclear distribution protein nudE [Teratosphaeria destructans]|uniref:Nuclear distribution protein nudE n=1 Tax=Teratosphaeria destructans TaxID=418781 RepID=A0A9W7SUT5_9PEZI|nr:Nuclear distribution protein nudE [Teratosphaeria destructans]
MTSSPLRPGASLEEELDYYKKQYEQLEHDLADFQTTSKDIEEQLERDIENAEKNERKLKEQVEKLKFEVEEWKGKHKQAKAEANGAQNVLEKEVTELREAKRNVEMRLRDTEVVNDDYERQARHTESSLEDLESKYNVAIERSVMLEEEVKVGEKEREALRIETQRLRDDLGDLKVENEITLEKLRLADETIERLRSRKPSPLAVENLRTRSPDSEASGVTPSSPTVSTPPPKSETMSDAAPTPPSPPLSDSAPKRVKPEPKTPSQTRKVSMIPDASITPRPSFYGGRTGPRHARYPSTAASTTSTAASEIRARRVPSSGRLSVKPSTNGSLPRSDSLYQIKALRGRMQKIEERVHSARSKLPAPGRTPTGSPRTKSALGHIVDPHIPASVTVRRSSKKGTDRSSLIMGEAAQTSGPDAVNGGRESQVNKRLSFGIPRSTSSLAERPAPTLQRPTSAASATRPPSAQGRPPSSHGRPPSSFGNRPSSRASMASLSTTGGRPQSRNGPGPAAPSASFSANFSASAGMGLQRPRSSFGGSSYSSMHSSASQTQTPRSLHKPSHSINDIRKRTEQVFEEQDATKTPSRRLTMEKGGAVGTGTPSGLPRRQSNQGHHHAQSAVSSAAGRGLRRMSTQIGESGGAMKPPPPRRQQQAEDLGETY